MLENNDKQKIEKYIEKIVGNVQKDVQKYINSRLSDKQVVEKVVNVTVNKITPESKMILSSVYNMLMGKTLQEPLFLESTNKAAFYEMDILKEIQNKFDFEVPSEINYEESKKTVNKLIASGAVVVVGGVISIAMDSWIPVGIAVILAGIMVALISRNKKTVALDSIISEYFDNVKASLLSWVETIVLYYDERVEELKGKLV